MSNNQMYQTIGIIGGLSPVSTVNYYQFIVQQHFKFFGNHYYPPIKITSVCYQQYTDWRLSHQWDVIAKNLTNEFTALANAGADFVLVACNAMHKAIPLLQSPIPILSIVDVAASEAQRHGIDTLILTGTEFTMTDGFLDQQLRTRGIKVLTPEAKGRAVIERIIRTELTLNIVSPDSATQFAQVVQDTMNQDHSSVPAKRYGVLLACTELGLLIPYLPTDLEYLDTASLHAMSAWEISTGQSPPLWAISNSSI